MAALDLNLTGEPVDPSYARFRDGFSKWIIGKQQYPGLRWSPWQNGGEWRTYGLREFDYIDFGVTGPASPLSSTFRFEPPGYVWDWALVLPQWKLPDVWREVGATYARYQATRPAAVWNPYDGSWREMRMRASSPAPDGEPPIENPNRSELARRLDDLIHQYRNGRITDAILKQRMLELTREYG